MKRILALTVAVVFAATAGGVARESIQGAVPVDSVRATLDRLIGTDATAR